MEEPVISRIRARLTYANVVATICLFLVLSGGTAVALSGSNTVFSDDIVDDQVFSADVRNDTLTDGGLTAADLRAGSVATSEVKNDAVTGIDVNESSFGVVPEASHAINSDRLGDRAASGYQRRVTGSCATPGAIQSIRGDGGVSCSRGGLFPPISADLSAPDSATPSLFPSNLGMLLRCQSDSAAVDFINNGFGGATLNWLFSQGGTQSTVNASGTSVPGRGGANVITFGFVNRLEGQWIFADGDGVVTVNLHAFFAPGSPSFCEFKGTAQWAPKG